jgi:hypothetical protein
MALLSDASDPDLPVEEQYKLVYAGIISVAQRCDGARSDDGIGFNGQDTHFGRRIASVPFEEWTQDIKEEAARIAATYRGQIEAYIGVNLNQLPVVREANEWDVVRDFSGVEPKGTSEKRGGQTNHAARDQARAIERRQAASHLIADRKAVKGQVEGTLRLTWNSKDPDCFGALLAAVKLLPGRIYDRVTQSNVVDFTPEAVDFIEEFALAADFDLTTARGEAAKVAQAIAERPHITLAGKGQVKLDTPYDRDMVEAIKSLPGRRYQGGSINLADLHPAILTFAKQFKLNVAADVKAALDQDQASKLDGETKATMLLFVSRQADPANLPPAFEALVAAGRTN